MSLPPGITRFADGVLHAPRAEIAHSAEGQVVIIGLADATGCVFARFCCSPTAAMQIGAAIDANAVCAQRHAEGWKDCGS